MLHFHHVSSLGKVQCEINLNICKCNGSVKVCPSNIIVNIALKHFILIIIKIILFEIFVHIMFYHVHSMISYHLDSMISNWFLPKQAKDTRINTSKVKTKRYSWDPFLHSSYSWCYQHQQNLGNSSIEVVKKYFNLNSYVTQLI